jgi:hypothetical protein
MGKVIDRSELLRFEVGDDGNLSLVPTEAGAAAARDLLEESGARGSLDQTMEMLSHFLENGWSTVPPEDIGALTDALIISRDMVYDGFNWTIVNKPTHVYAHMNYQVENPVETWASGLPVKFEGSGVFAVGGVG